MPLLYEVVPGELRLESPVGLGYVRGLVCQLFVFTVPLLAALSGAFPLYDGSRRGYCLKSAHRSYAHRRIQEWAKSKVEISAEEIYEQRSSKSCCAAGRR
jgi:hypothetical protein